MFTKFTLILVTIFLVIALAGCSPKSSTPSGSTENNSQNQSNAEASEIYTSTLQQMLPLISVNVANLQLDATADGTTQQLKKGEAMSITLESNPSTGYSWFPIISNPSVLVQMGEPEYLPPSSTPLPGAAGTQTFYFQAVDTGTTTLTLDYKRSWETNVAPAKTITVTVVVK